MAASPTAGNFGAGRFGAGRFASEPRSGGASVAPAAQPVPEPTILPRNRFRDLTALALLAGCLFVIAALATFDAADPPVSYGFPPHARATNACGFLGSIAASGLYEAFGLGAWIAVAAVAGFDLMLLRRRAMPDLPLRTAGGVVAVVGVCTLLAMFLPDWVARPIWGPGGHAGAIGRHFAEGYFAKTGAAIVVTAITGAGLFLACDTLALRAVAGMTAVVGSISTAFVAGLTHLRARLASRTRTVDGLAEAAADVATAYPGLRPRTAGGDAASDDEDGSEDDADGEFGPTIRVRRREKPLAAPEDDGEDDIDAVDASSDEGVDDASADDQEMEAAEEPRPVVPIKSLANRRRKPEAIQMAPDPTANYELPSLELLLPAEQLQLDEQEQEVRDRARVLEKTFADFGFKVRVVEIETGPVISQYEIELEAGLRLAKIANLADDLAIALRVPSVRIVAPIPGKNSVGIEVPNTTRQMVRLREVIEETQSKSRTMKIPLYFGKDVAGNPMVFDMASLPHLLIAGRTGTGKSVCLNSIIVSMLMTRRPDEVRMLMIDPKMVELTPYKALPHLMHPVVTDMKKAEAILAWAVEKMEERYAMLAKVGVRHLSQYNQLGREELLKRFNPETDEEAAAIPTTMPYIVMIADEIADMMMTAGKEIGRRDHGLDQEQPAGPYRLPGGESHRQPRRARRVRCGTAARQRRHALPIARYQPDPAWPGHLSLRRGDRPRDGCDRHERAAVCRGTREPAAGAVGRSPEGLRRQGTRRDVRGRRRGGDPRGSWQRVAAAAGLGRGLRPRCPADRLHGGGWRGRPVCRLAGPRGLDHDGAVGRAKRHDGPRPGPGPPASEDPAARRGR
jgi:S-DNA-T family DNA segregation ATPase FtsK/SpoIIIE